MKILNVVPWLAPRYGGPAMFVPDAAAALSQRGHEVVIVTTNVDGPAVLDVDTRVPVDWRGVATSFHAVHAPRRYLTSRAMLADLRRLIPTVDVVHIHGLYRFHGAASSALARWAGVPYVLQAHGSLDPWHRNQRRRVKDVYHVIVEDRIIGSAAAMIATSARERGALRDLGLRVPIWTIPIGIDAENLRRPVDGRFVDDLGVPPSAPLVTFLGRITEKKGVPLLVEAFHRVSGTHPNARLVLAGPDDERIGGGLARAISNAGLGDRVSFPGTVGSAERAALLQRSDVFVLPSADESFGIAVAEAMAVGCPVVITADVALAQMVSSASAGLVVDRDPASLAVGISRILEDPAGAQQMGKAGARAVDEQLGWPAVGAEMESMYESVVEGGQGRSRPFRRSSRTRNAPHPRTEHLTFEYRCPVCRAPLVDGAVDGEWSCSAGDWGGSSVDGIPVLLAHPEHAVHDELDHDHGHDHKSQQARHFDRPGQEAFEIERPHGTPRMYRAVIADKFRRAIEPVGPQLRRATALVVCGGSGMDAEAVAHAGGVVLSSDLSLGAARRARIRSIRHQVPFRSIVADVENLPFANSSIDLVAVHDGLHHLTDPMIGLAEMARVARRWVVVTEPARSPLTRIAIRIGMAQDIETAGNRVNRLDPRDVASALERHGFRPVRVERYLAYYRHVPGRVSAFMSVPIVFHVARAAWRSADALVGRIGNKFVVVAERAS